MSRAEILYLPTELSAALNHARHLAENGVPVFVAQPALDEEGNWDPTGGTGGTGYWMPKNWQNTEADPTVVDRWREGRALAAVTGHLVDVVDVDPRNGGKPLPASVMPTSYGHATTPSGGTHDFVASMGVGKGKLKSHPGIDIQAGDEDGEGRGFVFLAPTVRKSKTTGKIGAYTWVRPPDLAALALVGGDTSGAVLREEMRKEGAAAYTGPSYDGAAYEALSPGDQARAAQYVDSRFEHWRKRLAEAALQPERWRDDRGWGWMDLTVRAAGVAAALAVAPWTGLTPEEAKTRYAEIVPEVMVGADYCATALDDARLERIARRPIEPPPWSSPEQDFAEPLPDSFYDTPILRAVQTAAHARMAGSPMALLSCTLGRVLAEVPPSVCLPAVIGTRASLNIGVVLVDSSGGGKSTMLGVSGELLGLTGMDQARLERGVGSGEGMVEAFLEPEYEINLDTGKRTKTGNKVVISDPRRIITCDEIAVLGAIQGRGGNTTAPIIRTALTGGAIGQQNADPDRRRHVPGGSYRLVMIAGAQPSLTGVLLGDTDAGTPQRFIWCGMSDTTLPDEDVDWPDVPELRDWRLPVNLPADIDYPDEVKNAVRDLRRKRVTEPDMDVRAEQAKSGHIMLLRLKVAAALALLHGEAAISSRWWDKAGEIIEGSERIQAACVRTLAQTAQREENTKAVRADRTMNAVVADRMGDCRRSIMRKLESAGGEWRAWSELRPGVRVRDLMEEVLENLVAEGVVETEETEYRGAPARKSKLVVKGGRSEP